MPSPANASPPVEVLLLEDTKVVLPTLEALHPFFAVHVLRERDDRARVLTALGGRVRGLVTSTLTGCDGALIAALPRLEIIACVGAHVDRIDLGAAAARRIPVTNTPSVSTDEVADLVLGQMLCVARRLPAADRFVRDGRWRREPMPLAHRVYGRRLGIVGLGAIGRAVAARAAGFRMEIAYHGPRRKEDVAHRYFADLVAMAAWADFLAVTCRTGPATRGLVNGRVLAALGPEGYVVNVTRGVLDEAALRGALEAGGIAGAASDAFDDEPNLAAEWLGLENVVLSPHVGSATAETRWAMAEAAVVNLRAHFAGRPLPNLVAVGH